MGILNMKVEILSRNVVKPASPTPNHLRNYKLSLLDQLTSHYHGAIVFFYSAPPHSNNNNNKYNNNGCFKKSLSETLSRFYPLAGRFKDSSTIDCNDEGAYLIEAKINCKLSEFLSSQPSFDTVQEFVPILDPVTMDLASSDSMLIVQLTEFHCKGMAMSFCLNHRFCDLPSVLTFLRTWTSIFKGAGEEEEEDLQQLLPHDYIGSSLLPPKDDVLALSFVNDRSEKHATTRLVFDESKIAALRAKVGASFLLLFGKNQYPSRVEMVLALILKRAMVASHESTMSKSSRNNPSVVYQTVNLRRRMEPPLPENSMGNHVWLLPVLIENSNVGFQELVSKLRKETMQFYNDKTRKFEGEEGRLMVMEYVKEREEMMKKIRHLDTYQCASWCKLPLDEVDFGWGKPVWVSSGVVRSRNMIIMADTPCGNGVQAWVTLEKEIMAIFEGDEELLEFASINPSVVA